MPQHGDLQPALLPDAAGFFLEPDAPLLVASRERHRSAAKREVEQSRAQRNRQERGRSVPDESSAHRVPPFGQPRRRQAATGNHRGRFAVEAHIQRPGGGIPRQTHPLVCVGKPLLAEPAGAVVEI